MPCAFIHSDLDLKDCQEIDSLQTAFSLKVARNTRQFKLMHNTLDHAVYYMETVHLLTLWTSLSYTFLMGLHDGLP